MKKANITMCLIWSIVLILLVVFGCNAPVPVVKKTIRKKVTEEQKEIAEEKVSLDKEKYYEYLFNN